MKKYIPILLAGFVVISVLGAIIAATVLTTVTNKQTPNLTQTTVTPSSTPSSFAVDENNNVILQQTLGDSSPSGSPESQQNDNDIPFEEYQQYKDNNGALTGDITVGTGSKTVAVGSKVGLTYTGWLTDGTKFDESGNKTFSFLVGDGKVIKGFEQGVIGMKLGGKRRIIIPPSVGYGSQEQNGIPANSVLVFGVELISIE